MQVVFQMCPLAVKEHIVARTRSGGSAQCGWSRWASRDTPQTGGAPPGGRVRWMPQQPGTGHTQQSERPQRRTPP